MNSLLNKIILFVISLCVAGFLSAETLQPINDTQLVESFVQQLAKSKVEPLYRDLRFIKHDGEVLLNDQQTSAVYKLYQFQLPHDKTRYYVLATMGPCLEPPCDNAMSAIFRVDTKQQVQQLTS